MLRWMRKDRVGIGEFARSGVEVTLAEDRVEVAGTEGKIRKKLIKDSIVMKMVISLIMKN